MLPNTTRLRDAKGKAIFTASLLALGLALGACTNTAANNVTTNVPVAGSPPGPQVINTTIVSNAQAQGTGAFGPNPLVVPSGSTVIWTNGDSIPHTVTSTTGVFDSGVIEPGDSYSQTFNNPGSYPYVSTLPGDQNMSGTVEVSSPSPTPSPSPSVTPSPSPSPSPTIPVQPGSA